MHFAGLFRKAGVSTEIDLFNMGQDGRYVSSGLVVDNSTGGGLGKGDLVYLTGFDTATNRPNCVLADADSSVARATHVLQVDIANGATGLATPAGMVTGTTANVFDTNSFTAIGQLLYLSGTATTTNTLTETKPVGNGQFSQLVGILVVKSATIGRVYFFPGHAIVDSAIASSETLVHDTQLTDTNILALAATPITVVPAPAAGFANVVHAAYFHLDVGAGAYDDAAADGDLGLIYEDGADQTAGMTVQADTFIDSATDVGRFLVNGYDPVGDAALPIIPIAAKAIQLNNDGAEFTTVSNDTSTNTLSVRVWYSIVAVAAFT